MASRLQKLEGNRTAQGFVVVADISIGDLQYLVSDSRSTRKLKTGRALIAFWFSLSVLYRVSYGVIVRSWLKRAPSFAMNSSKS